MPWQPQPRPVWVESLNALGEGLGDSGRSLVPLDTEELLRRSAALTGLDDYGDSWFREPLQVFVDALEEEAELTLLGRILARSEIERILQNRLRIENSIVKNPEITETEITAPIFITGLARSGTTLLHELLGQDPANRVPLLWEMMYTVPAPEPESHLTDPRVAKAHQEITVMDTIDPSFTAMHENAGHLPNECIFIFAHEFATDMWVGTYPIPRYTTWLSGADISPTYGYHRRFLQLLQSRHPGERWVLKAPSHLSCLPELFQTYPDARVVMAHRDPLKVISSLTHLMATLQSMRSNKVNYEGIVAAMAFGLGYLLENANSQRDSGEIPNSQISDVCYTDLIANPLETVRTLYQGWGLPLEKNTERRMQEYLNSRHRGRAVLHDYAFEDTGLDLKTERARHADYRKRFGVLPEV